MLNMIENFSVIFNTKEKVKGLRNLILELAVRGKIVNQDHLEESAEVLLGKIYAEKEKLLKRKKIRKSELLPSITNDEKPFELPISWRWVRLGEMGDIKGGKRIPKGYGFSEQPTQYVYLRVTDMKNGTIVDDNIKYIDSTVFKQIENYTISKDDLYITIAGTIGAVGTIPEKYSGMNLTENASKLCFYSISNCVKEYFKFALLSDLVQNQFLEKVNQMAQPKLALERVATSLVPLPPIAEQHRIVKKIDELMALCDILETTLEKKANFKISASKSFSNMIGKSESQEELYTSLSMLLDNFKDVYSTKENVKNLRDSILQLAVQGKLVPQNPTDEPASVLLSKIETEKQRLIKEKKIKKSEPLPSITEEDIPFELPKGWQWVRFGTVFQVNPVNKADDGIEGSFIPMSLIRDGFSNSHSSEKKLWAEIKKGFTHFMDDDIGIAKITPCFQNRKSVVFTGLYNHIGSGTTELHVLRKYIKEMCSEYFLLVVKTSAFINKGIKTYTGTAGQQRIGKDFIASYVIALPPLSEQHRIVEKVDQLMRLCDELEKSIEESQNTSGNLMKSVLKNFIAI